MSNFSLKLSDEKIEKLKETFRQDLKPSPSEYIKAFIQNDNVTITVYTSNKVVFQGQDAFFYASSFFDTKQVRMAGSDEVGTGDYFGPVVVCAAIVEVEDYEYLNKNGITDSKQMDDAHIMELGDKLVRRFKHSLLILDNEKYNRVHETNNLNQIKAKMHNQAYVNLLKKNYDVPKLGYVDQFCDKTAYFTYLASEKQIYRDLVFETKAESKYAAVAVASCISRYAFLTYMKELNKKYQFNFHLGASDIVDQDIQMFVKKFGKEQLNKVAKLHFKNTEKINEVKI